MTDDAARGAQRPARRGNRLRRRWHYFWWPTLDPDVLPEGGCVVAHEWFTRGGSDKVASALAEAVGATAVVCLSMNPSVVAGLGIDAPVHQCRLGAWAVARSAVAAPVAAVAGDLGQSRSWCG